MISGLLSNVNDEDKYIRKLTHFVDVEEAYACGQNIDTLNYDYEQLNLEILPHFVGCSVRKLNIEIYKCNAPGFSLYLIIFFIDTNKHHIMKYVILHL